VGAACPFTRLHRRLVELFHDLPISLRGFPGSAFWQSAAVAVCASLVALGLRGSAAGRCKLPRTVPQESSDHSTVVLWCRIAGRNLPVYGALSAGTRPENKGHHRFAVCGAGLEHNVLSGVSLETLLRLVVHRSQRPCHHFGNDSTRLEPCRRQSGRVDFADHHALLSFNSTFGANGSGFDVESEFGGAFSVRVLAHAALGGWGNRRVRSQQSTECPSSFCRGSS